MMNLFEYLLRFLRQNNLQMYQRVLDDLDGADTSMRGLNNYFRLVLTKVPVCVLSERECLVEGLSDAAWLDYFETTVYPTLDKYDLPQA